MKEPIINWFVNEDNQYSACSEYYAGTYNLKDDFIIESEVWNNKWGTEDVADIPNGILCISFANAEDSVLLKFCEVKINDDVYRKVDNTEFNRGTIKVGRLSGSKNNGSSSNTDNYKKITIKFSNAPTNIRDELKNMFISIE